MSNLTGFAECCKKTFTVADEFIKIIEELVREDVFETEIAGAGEGKARSLGANWFVFKTVVASGIRSNGVVPAASSKKSLQNGKTLMVEISPRFNGYAGVAGYTYVMGNKTNEAQKTCFNDMVEAYRITKSSLVPGTKERDIDSKTGEFLVEKDMLNIWCAHLSIPSALWKQKHLFLVQTVMIYCNQG